jgi:hypothetical protein
MVRRRKGAVMERLTSNKKVSDMSMIELAHNSCYADNERNARYRDYEMDMDARDFVRKLIATLAKDEMPISNTEFDEEILDDLAIDPFSDVRGLISLFYRNLWAMANLRETLKKYEDLEEQDRLVKLPCKVGDTVYAIGFNNNKPIIYESVVLSILITEKEIAFNVKVDEFEINSQLKQSMFDKTVFLTKSEAEAKLKELRGGENGSME